jgi:hypothetical protein
MEAGSVDLGEERTGMGRVMWARRSMRRRVSGTRPVRRGVALRMVIAMRRHWMSQRVRMVRNPMSQRAARTVGEGEVVVGGGGGWSGWVRRG